jgi:formate dehydrogenase subunit gamma
MMFASTARGIAALVLGVALVLPLSVVAQAPAPSNISQAAPKDLAAAEAARGAVPPPPFTAPTGEVPVNPERGAKPGVSTATGPTSIAGWNHPPQSWEPASALPQYASLPGRDTNILIQVTGRGWREFHNGPLTQYGGWLIALVFASIMAFYFWKGPIRLHREPTGRTIERFNAIERTSHWTMAICFTLLAISGVAMFWGKYLILPWLGYSAYSWLITTLKTLHNFVGPLFIVSLATSFLLFVKDNFWRSYDFTWLLRMGGMFSKGEEVPSGRFNAGEKAWFWGGLVFLGALVSLSGLVLDFPNFNQGRPLMQLANTVHLIAAILFIAMSFGHIYLGTIGMEGSYRAMRKGHVDEEWAREHHALWYEEVKRGKRPGKIVAGRWQPGGAD